MGSGGTTGGAGSTGAPGAAARRGASALTDEASLADFWAFYAASPHRRAAFAARHPVRILLALLAVLRLPRVPVRVPAAATDAGAAAVRRLLATPGVAGVPARATGMAVLALPADPAAYDEGPRRATVRRKCRAAERHGVRCRPVTDPAERTRLVGLAHEAERAHPDAWYRNERPDNADLLDHDAWLVAEAADGRPLLLAVTPVCGEVAVLRYFRTLEWGPVPGDARWLATRELVRLLVGRGVRWLVDPDHPGEQSNGVRHFQRMLGFRYARLVQAGVQARRGG